MCQKLFLLFGKQHQKSKLHFVWKFLTFSLTSIVQTFLHTCFLLFAAYDGPTSMGCFTTSERDGTRKSQFAYDKSNRKTWRFVLENIHERSGVKVLGFFPGWICINFISIHDLAFGHYGKHLLPTSGAYCAFCRQAKAFETNQILTITGGSRKRPLSSQKSENISKQLDN